MKETICHIPGCYLDPINLILCGREKGCITDMPTPGSPSSRGQWHEHQASSLAVFGILTPLPGGVVSDFVSTYAIPSFWLFWSKARPHCLQWLPAPRWASKLPGMLHPLALTPASAACALQECRDMCSSLTHRSLQVSGQFTRGRPLSECSC